LKEENEIWQKFIVTQKRPLKNYDGKLKLVWMKVWRIVGGFIINKYVKKRNKYYSVYAIFSTS